MTPRRRIRIDRDRARGLRAGLGAVLVLVLAAGVAAGGASTAAASGGGDLSGGAALSLDAEHDGVVGAGSEPLATGGGSILPEGDGPTEGEEAHRAAAVAAPTGTDDELGSQRARLVAERNELQRALIAQEARRRAAETKRDDAARAIAQALVDLLESGRDERVRAIVEARDATGEEERAELVRALPDATDRALFSRADAAQVQVDALARRAEATRTRILQLGTQVAAIDAVLDERAGPSESELARERGERYSIDADYVFATGPIPSIGYWGAASGGGMLSGWMGYASAAVGGVGCEPSDPALKPTGRIESGEASWYGPGFQGNNTANGETFDTNEMTAAHKTLPFGTIVRVYSSATAQCAFVRINDRGPYIDGRVIDLSRAAADAIGMESVAPVQLEVYERG